MTQSTILVVDHDPTSRELITSYLHQHHFRPLAAAQGSTAIQLVKKEQPDLILLDPLLPDMDGFELCKEIRAQTMASIIFVTAKQDELDIILGLSIGGDDYVTKPFCPKQLIARIKAHLRRNRRYLQHHQPEHLIQVGTLKLDLASYTVTIADQSFTLSKKEFKLLAFLARHPNQTFTVNQLYGKIWGLDSLSDTRTVMVHIHNLRKKIEKNPSKPMIIETVRGVGYKLSTEALWPP